MKAGKIIAYVVAGILIFFGVLFIWGATGDQGSGGNVIGWMGRSAPRAAISPRLWLSWPALPSLKRQICQGRAGHRAQSTIAPRR